LNIEIKVYLFDLPRSFMKELDIYTRTMDLSKVTEILEKYKAVLTFYPVEGHGRTKRDPIPEMVESYMTGKKITPEFEQRSKVETIVPDSSVKGIVEDLLSNFPDTEPRGMIFVKEVSNAYEIGTKQSDEAILTH
jgi:nitrogen regulatory protein P-II 1